MTDRLEWGGGVLDIRVYTEVSIKSDATVEFPAYMMF